MLERVNYRLVFMVYNRLHGKAPQYLMDCCIPISDVASRRHLSSASRHHLVVPRHNLSTYGRRAFAVAGSAAWNSLSDDVHDLAFSLTVSVICLRLVCFQSTNGYYTSCHSCAVQFHDLLTYLLTRPHVTATLILEMLKVTPSRYPTCNSYSHLGDVESNAKSLSAILLRLANGPKPQNSKSIILHFRFQVAELNVNKQHPFNNQQLINNVKAGVFTT